VNVRHLRGGSTPVGHSGAEPVAGDHDNHHAASGGPRRVRTRADAQAERQAARAADPLSEYPLIRAQALIGAAIQLEAARPVEYLWDGIVTPGNIVIIGGPPGDGKSTALMLMAMARRNTTGEPIQIFGRAMKPAAPDRWIVIVENEQGAGLTSRQLVQSCEMLGPPAAVMLERVIMLARKEVTIGSPTWQEVSAMTRAGLVDSVWVDSLARTATGTDSNDADDQAAVFGGLQGLLESSPHEAKPTLWLLGHTRKPKPHARDTLTLADLAGSVQRAAQIDVGILLRAERDEWDQVTCTVMTFPKVRDRGDEPIPGCTLTIKRHSGRRTVEWSSPRARAEDEGGMTAPDKVCELLRAGGDRTENEIAKMLGMGKPAVARAIGVLLATKRIRKRQKPVRGKMQNVFTAQKSFAEMFGGGEGEVAFGDPTDV
jgi:energy-coupling factor transporter ATP-binding protein EcfA2